MALKKHSRVRIQQSLRRLVGKKVIVKLWRENIDSHEIIGYVVDLSSDFVVIHVQDDAIILDGYAILRIQDITLVEDKLKRGDFYVEALKLRGYTPKLPVGISLNSIASILEAVNKHYPLLVVYREGIFRDECTIGRIEKLTEKTLILQCLTPGAQWDGYSPRYRLASAFRIDFDGLYEDALARVARIQSDESGVYGEHLNFCSMKIFP